jgi:hypothetical protein
MLQQFLGSFIKQTLIYGQILAVKYWHRNCGTSGKHASLQCARLEEDEYVSSEKSLQRTFAICAIRACRMPRDDSAERIIFESVERRELRRSIAFTLAQHFGESCDPLPGCCA